MGGTLERTVGREPTLATISYEEMMSAAEQKRKAPFARLKPEGYNIGRAVRKAAVAVAAAGALVFAGMHLGATYHRQVADFENTVTSYFSSTAPAVENQNITAYGGGN
jgi:hypothetical protein